MRRSRVGQKLTDIVTLRVVLGILALLVIVPGFNVNSNLYGTEPDMVAGGLAMLTAAYVVTPTIPVLGWQTLLSSCGLPDCAGHLAGHDKLGHCMQQRCEDLSWPRGSRPGPIAAG